MRFRRTDTEMPGISLARSCAIARNIARLQPEEGMAAVVENEENWRSGLQAVLKAPPAYSLRLGAERRRGPDA
jgi:hypothetical protein